MGGGKEKEVRKKILRESEQQQRRRTRQLHFKRIRGQSSVIVVRKRNLLGREDDWSQYFVL